MKFQPDLKKTMPKCRAFNGLTSCAHEQTVIELYPPPFRFHRL